MDLISKKSCLNQNTVISLDSTDQNEAEIDQFVAEIDQFVGYYILLDARNETGLEIKLKEKYLEYFEKFNASNESMERQFLKKQFEKEETLITSELASDRFEFWIRVFSSLKKKKRRLKEATTAPINYTKKIYQQLR